MASPARTSTTSGVGDAALGPPSDHRAPAPIPTANDQLGAIGAGGSGGGGDKLGDQQPRNVNSPIRADGGDSSSATATTAAGGSGSGATDSAGAGDSAVRQASEFNNRAELKQPALVPAASGDDHHHAVDFDEFVTSGRLAPNDASKDDTPIDIRASASASAGAGAGSSEFSLERDLAVAHLFHLVNWEAMKVDANSIQLIGATSSDHRTISMNKVIGAAATSPTSLDIVILKETRTSKAAIVSARVSMKKRTVRLECKSVKDMALIVRLIQWFARRPQVEPNRSKHLLAVINPHGGKGKATTTWESEMRPLLECGGLTFDVSTTDHAGHAMEMGREYDPNKYEGVVVFGGDGTCQEFTAGMCSRSDWANLIRRTPIATVKLGSTNAVAQGLRTVEPAFAAFCIVKRYLRPLDAMVITNAAGMRTISLCVAGWGMASAVALESESTRSILGIYRYSYLKGRHALQMALGYEKFTASVEYSADTALTDPELATYFARSEAPEQWYKLHSDDKHKPVGDTASAASGGKSSATMGKHSELANTVDGPLQLSPRAVSMYTHGDAVARVVDTFEISMPRGATTVNLPPDSIYGLGGSSNNNTAAATATAGASASAGVRARSGSTKDGGGPHSLVNLLATTVEVVEAATAAASTPSPPAPASSTAALTPEELMSLPMPHPVMRTKDGQVLVSKAHGEYTPPVPLPGHLHHGSEAGSVGVGEGEEKDAADLLLHPVLASKMVESPAAVRRFAAAQRVMDVDIVHVDDSNSIKPPAPTDSGPGVTPATGTVGTGSPFMPAAPATAGAGAGAGSAMSVTATPGGETSTPGSIMSDTAISSLALWERGGFGELTVCQRNCKVCSQHGRLRFIGHRLAEPAQVTLPVTDPLAIAAGAAGGGAGSDLTASPMLEQRRPAAMSMSSDGASSDGESDGDDEIESPSTADTPASEGGGSGIGGGQETPETIAAKMIEWGRTTADISKATHCTTLGLSLTSRGYVKRKERGSYVAIVALNLAPEAKYQHGSDGYFDLFTVRTGTAAAALNLFGRYVGAWTGMSEIYGSDLIDYVKVRTLVISPDEGQEDTVLNVDGEAFPGPGPFRCHMLPSLITAYGTF